MKFFSQYQNLFLSPGPVCQTCGKVFTQLKNLNQHVRTIHEKSSTTFSCSQCHYTTPLKSNLKRQAKRHTHLTPNLPPKIARREPIPNIIDPPANDHLLEQLENHEIQTMFNQNTQVGFGITQMTSADATLPDEIQQLFRAERPWGTDRNLRQVYIKNFPRIRDSETLNCRSRIYPRYLNHTNSPLIETIVHAIEDIFYRQTNAFKMNLSFSFILQHRETGEYRYHYASNNNQFLNTPRLIRNQRDLENLLDHLAAKDFPSHLKDQRPNTKWIIERIVSLRIHLVMTTYPLGNLPKLPDYIKNNRFIIGLEKDQHNAYRYKDHLCFFRCLAIGKFEKNPP